MANTVTLRKALDSSRYFSTTIDIVGDGSGEESDTLVIDSSALFGGPSDFKIRAIQWSLDGFSAELLWDATTNVHAFTLPSGSDGIRFADTGAHLLNNAGTGKTGDLLITTIGLADGLSGTIIIEGQHT